MKKIAAKALEVNNFSIYILSFFILFACSRQQKEVINEKKTVTILVQPFNDMKVENIEFVVNKIRQMYPEVKILDPIDFPKTAYYKPRNRYRADSLISFLSKNTKGGFVTIGLTSKDISATKGNIKDFGIMGLGFRPGNACVASSFRLNKKNSKEQFFKIVVHELGHTQGLKHCPIKECFMRNAEGKNPTNEETGFCKKCKQILINNNWKFSSI